MPNSAGLWESMNSAKLQFASGSRGLKSQRGEPGGSPLVTFWLLRGGESNRLTHATHRWSGAKRILTRSFFLKPGGVRLLSVAFNYTANIPVLVVRYVGRRSRIHVTQVTHAQPARGAGCRRRI